MGHRVRCFSPDSSSGLRSSSTEVIYYRFADIYRLNRKYRDIGEFILFLKVSVGY